MTDNRHNRYIFRISNEMKTKISIKWLYFNGHGYCLEPGLSYLFKCLRRRDRKALTDVADVTLKGREFQSSAPEYEMLFLNKSTRGQGTTSERLFRSDRCDTVERLNKLER